MRDTDFTPFVPAEGLTFVLWFLAQVTHVDVLRMWQSFNFFQKKSTHYLEKELNHVVCLGHLGFLSLSELQLSLKAICNQV